MSEADRQRLRAIRQNYRRQMREEIARIAERNFQEDQAAAKKREAAERAKKEQPTPVHEAYANPEQEASVES